MAAKKYINTKHVKISTICWLKVSAGKPGIIQVKKTFNDIEPWMEINVFKKGVTVEDISNSALPMLTCTSQISEAKKVDLKNLIPFLQKPEDKEFYENLISK